MTLYQALPCRRSNYRSILDGPNWAMVVSAVVLATKAENRRNSRNSLITVVVKNNKQNFVRGRSRLRLRWTLERASPFLIQQGKRWAIKRCAKTRFWTERRF